MKKYMKKGMSIFLTLSMTVCMLAGCGSSDAKKTSDNNSKKAQSTTVNTAQVEQLLTNKLSVKEDADNDISDESTDNSSSGQADKKETVYVEMKADGQVLKTTVSDVLKSTDNATIEDISDLEDITNLSGDEKFTKTGDTNISWENKGEDITYQGTTTKEAPISIQVKYYLDDEEISADDLAGKSGSVKIVYKYTNNSEKSGKFIPFIILTGMVFDENFSNIKVDNGKVVDYSDSNIVVGYGAPGVKDYMLDTIDKAEDYIKDIDIPDSVTVTADVKDFSMNMTLSVATSSIGDLDLTDSLDLSDLESQMDELQSGTDQLQDGAGELVAGAEKLDNGAEKIDDGAENIAKYTADLYLGTTKLLSSYNKFNKALLSGINSVKKGSDKLYKGTKKVKKASGQLDTGAKKLDSAASKIDSGADSIASGLKEAKAGFEDTKDSKGNVQQGLVNGSKNLESGVKTANKGVQSLVSTLQSTPDSIAQQIEGVVNKVSTATGGAIASEAALTSVVEAINSAVTAGKPLEDVLASQRLNASTYYQLLQAYYSVQTLESVKATFEAQISASASDIKQLVDGMNSLEKGATAINTGIDTLYAGIKQLSAGADTLASGTGEMSAGTKSLSKGTGKLKTGTSSLNKGMKTLNNGTKKMKSKLSAASPKVKDGISTVNSGAGKISAGAKTLAEGTGTLGTGIVTLLDGTKTLQSGIIKLNKEGISKITDIFGDDAQNAIDSVEEILNNGKDYQSFTGISDDMSGNVKFIFKTAEIGTDK